ncbi:MAG: branched-chain-amino-acid transaminase [Deltaproteobacteria bacterium]|nr:branched-chain-amino-acid transaminase [Deltaproteobacteria bacterium]
MIVYINGDYMSEEEAKISVFDHGFLYGDGVFEGIKAYNGRVFALDEHVDRFYESAQSIQLELPVGRDEMKKAIVETVRRNNLRDAYIRPVASRGKGALGLDPKSCAEATVVIMVDAEIRHPEDKGETSLSQKGIRVITTAFRRNGPDVLSPRIKSTNYLNNILAKLQANAVGVQDAVFLNEQGLVCELTGDNLFIVKHTRVITPPLWLGILDGITRRTILRIAKEAGMEAVEEPLTLHDLYTSDECFCTATRIEVAPIVWVDGRQIGSGNPGPITTQLTKTFFEKVDREGTPIYSG